MRIIYKYEVELADEFTVRMPRGSEVLTVQIQGDRPQMWAVVDNDQPLIPRRFRLLGTGHPPLSDDIATVGYVGTFQLHDGALVFHLFEL